MADSEVVILDAAGTEHVFPPGFDPKKAAAIVRQQTSKGDTKNLDRLVATLPDAAAETRGKIAESFARRPIFDIGAGAANLGARSDPNDVISGALHAINPLALLQSLASAGHLLFNPSEIPGAANAALDHTLAHPGDIAGGAIAAQAIPPVLRFAGPPVARGTIRAAAGVGDVVSPEVVGLVSPKAKNWLALAQQLRDKMATPQPAVGAAPRLAGRAPALNDVLTDAVNAVRQGEPPASVSLPGGNTYRAEGSIPTASSARPAAPAAPSAAAPESSAPKTRGAAPSASPRPASPVVMEGLRLTEDEARAFQALTQDGYQPAEVLKAIQGQRAAAALAGRFGLPSDAEVGAAVADRNATGRWPQDHR